MSMEGPGATVERLLQATNAHDLERLVACFADDYRNETPVHPARWEMRGTRRDGTAHLMRGCIVFGVTAATIRWARFYLEPVDENGATVDQAVREQVVRQ